MPNVHRSLRGASRSIHLALPLVALGLAVAACGAEAESSDELVDDLEMAASPPGGNIAVTPDSVRAWDAFVVSGCVTKSGWVNFTLTSPTGQVTSYTPAALGGQCYSMTRVASAPLGVWKAELYEILATGTGGRKLMAATTFTVIDGCGNGTCNPDESCSTCPADCPCPTCGDGSCNGDETCATCAGDCGACPFCGDGACLGQELCDTCPADCGVCNGDGT
jgi:hypothetical protein